jgi:hypothetical protein
VTPPVASAETRAAPMSLGPGLVLAALFLCLYGAAALTVDFPRAALGIQSDEATYYMMGHSLAEDGDLTYRREDLMRVWREFSSGPAGLFLKRGRDITGLQLARRPPFFVVTGGPDPVGARLYYGKSFIYPLFAAPFVKVFGTNGFLVLHAVLLALVALAAYLFLHARTPAVPSLVLAGAFVLASIVPVYFVWITPELFNFAIVLLAYFCWLYKEVADPVRSPRGTAWLFSVRSDLVAAALLGIATFSKPTEVLLVPPMLLWLAYRRQWRRLVSAGFVVGAVAAALFAINLGVTGDWNYQGGERKTFYWEFPFQTPASTFDAIGTPMARDEGLGDIIFDRRVFWTNLSHNAAYYFVGRYAGIAAYFFPAVFALALFLAAPRRRPIWQWLVLSAAIAQMLLFIISLPYTWLGGGGSVGNRYFMGVYGIFLFLLPPVGRTLAAFVPWVAGGLFVAPMVINPFVASFRPGDNAKHGPLRLLPPELTLVNDLPINTDASRVRVWFGDNPGVGDLGFQIYFLDDDAYGREADKSFWVKGESRAQLLIKTDRPIKRVNLMFTAGPLATDVDVAIGRRSQSLHVPAEESRQITFTPAPGFWYQARAFVWVVSISSSTGFTPVFYGASDARYLGVRVKPTLVPE